MMFKTIVSVVKVMAATFHNIYGIILVLHTAWCKSDCRCLLDGVTVP
jgi:hypothetical protein